MKIWTMLKLIIKAIFSEPLTVRIARMIEDAKARERGNTH